MVITKIEDARSLKTMKLPLNLPIEDRTFSEEYSKNWFALYGAYEQFIVAVHDHAVGPRAGSFGKFRLLQRRFVALHKQMRRCDDFCGKLAMSTSEQDQHEAQILAYFLIERATPFYEFWADIITTLEDGGEVAINPSDIPRWIDE
jgi:hypothetical protein